MSFVYPIWGHTSGITAGRVNPCLPATILNPDEQSLAVSLEEYLYMVWSVRRVTVRAEGKARFEITGLYADLREAEFDHSYTARRSNYPNDTQLDRLILSEPLPGESDIKNNVNAHTQYVNLLGRLFNDDLWRGIVAEDGPDGYALRLAYLLQAEARTSGFTSLSGYVDMRLGPSSFSTLGTRFSGVYIGKNGFRMGCVAEIRSASNIEYTFTATPDSYQVSWYGSVTEPQSTYTSSGFCKITIESAELF